MSERRYLRITVADENGGEGRTFRLSHRRARLLVAGTSLALLLLMGMAGSWWYVAARAGRVSALQAELAVLERDRGRVDGLAQQLAELERRYDQIRRLFGTEGAQVASDLWLPPPAPRSPGVRSDPDPDGSLPTSWPLAERGFLTQTLLAGGAGEHPGIDIAVPADSYIRASGAGVVTEVGDDEVYGIFVRLAHGDGYESLYAHASDTFVEAGQRVRRNEVIALSGSTGRSTAPHLHFEILLNGETVDPLTMVRQP